MIRFIERYGERELIYEGNAVQDVLEMKKALNPSAVCGSSASVSEEGPDRCANKTEVIGFKPD